MTILHLTTATHLTFLETAKDPMDCLDIARRHFYPDVVPSMKEPAFKAAIAIRDRQTDQNIP